MIKLSRMTVRSLPLALAAMLPMLAHSAIYSPTRITHVMAAADGGVYMKWDNSPRPGPCAAANSSNNGWVRILPGAAESMKSLAFSVYFSGVPARVDTSGCDGAYEIVTALYTPSG